MCVGEPDYDNNFNAKLTKWKVGPEPEEIIVDRNNNTAGHGRFTQGEGLDSRTVRIYAFVYVCMYVCMYVCVCTCILMSMFVFIYVCMY